MKKTLLILLAILIKGLFMPSPVYAAGLFTGGNSSVNGSLNACWQASGGFDGYTTGDFCNNGHGGWVNNTSGAWIKYDLGSGNDATINEIKLYPAWIGCGGGGSSNTIHTFTVEGSTDNASWDSLYTGTNNSNTDTGWLDYVFGNTTAYRYYRLSAGTSYCDYWGVMEWEGYANPIPTSTPTPTPTPNTTPSPTPTPIANVQPTGVLQPPLIEQNVYYLAWPQYWTEENWPGYNPPDSVCGGTDASGLPCWDLHYGLFNNTRDWRITEVFFWNKAHAGEQNNEDFIPDPAIDPGDTRTVTTGMTGLADCDPNVPGCIDSIFRLDFTLENIHDSSIATVSVSQQGKKGAQKLSETGLGTDNPVIPETCADLEFQVPLLNWHVTFPNWFCYFQRWFYSFLKYVFIPDDSLTDDIRFQFEQMYNNKRPFGYLAVIQGWDFTTAPEASESGGGSWMTDADIPTLSFPVYMKRTIGGDEETVNWEVTPDNWDGAMPTIRLIRGVFTAAIGAGLLVALINLFKRSL